MYYIGSSRETGSRADHAVNNAGQDADEVRRTLSDGLLLVDATVDDLRERILCSAPVVMIPVQVVFPNPPWHR